MFVKKIVIGVTFVVSLLLVGTCGAFLLGVNPGNAQLLELFGVILGGMILGGITVKA